MKILAMARPFALALPWLLAIAPIAAAQTPDAQRIDRLEALVRTLTGQVEELTFRLQQLQQQLEVMQRDTEFRFQQLGAPAAPAPTAPPTPAAATPAPAPATAGAAPLTIDLGAPPAGPGAALTTPAMPGAGQPLDLGAVLGNNNALPAATITMTGDPLADYNTGYQLIRNGDYAEAEQLFRAFVATYPGTDLSADAQYWVAETLFSRELYREAVPEYLAAYNANPASELAPTALYKLGLSYLALNDVAAACDSFGRILRDFPSASNALRQSVAAAQANARCG